MKWNGVEYTSEGIGLSSEHREFIYSNGGCVYTGGGQLVAEGWETTSHLIASNF